MVGQSSSTVLKAHEGCTFSGYIGCASQHNVESKGKGHEMEVGIIHLFIEIRTGMSKKKAPNFRSGYNKDYSMIA